MAVVAAGLVNVISPRTAGPFGFAPEHRLHERLARHLLHAQRHRVRFAGYAVATRHANHLEQCGDLKLDVARICTGHQLDPYRCSIRLGAVDGARTSPTCGAVATKRPLRKRISHPSRASHLPMTCILAAIMTLGGPKGTVTLAVILTIPQAIAQRQLILFLACGVIVVTLLLATFVVPILAPQKKRDNTEQLEARRPSEPRHPARRDRGAFRATDA